VCIKVLPRVKITFKDIFILKGDKVVKVYFFKTLQSIIILAFTIFRIISSNLISAWYPSSQAYDDHLMIAYASLASHFKIPDSLTLVKTMSYPIFLRIVHWSGLSYTIILSIIWIIAAILVVTIFSYITNNILFLRFAYLFILFTPSAFDSWIGTRLYRNSCLAPFILILFACLLLIIIRLIKDEDLSAKKIICLSIMSGFIFTFSYYIKEDGIWLLFCLIFAILVSFGIVIYKYLHSDKSIGKSIMLIIILYIPLMIFILSSNIYKSINYHYFGVYETNTRTEGELGNFVNNVYKIHSNYRTAFVWAPYDAIEKAFHASNTLSMYPDLKDKIIITHWFGDIRENPITGDFLTWVLRSALVDSGLWHSERQISDLFKQVNIELMAAFNDGTLVREDKFQIMTSTGGRSLNEIFRIKNIMIEEYKNCILLDGYVPGGSLSEDTDISSCETATLLANMNFLPLNGPANNHKIKDLDYGNIIASVIFKVYSKLNPILIVFSILGLLITCCLMMLKRRKNKSINTFIVLTMFVLIGISIVYSFGIGWFAEYIWGNNPINAIITKYYGVGLVPMVSLFELFGTYSLFKHINDFFHILKQK